MAYNPWNKRPPLLPTRTREFTLQSGDVLKLTFRKLGTVQNNRVAELSQTLIERYVTGDAEFVESQGQSGQEPIPLPLAEPMTDPISESMCQQAAFASVMQLGPEDTRLTPEEWLGFQVVEAPEDWLAIQKFATEVQRIGKPANPKAADVPNGSGAVTNTSSERPSLNTDNTPKSPPE